MLLFWGIENFGIWIFITAIPSTLAMLNLNFSLAVKIEMSINFTKINVLRKTTNILESIF